MTRRQRRFWLSGFISGVGVLGLVVFGTADPVQAYNFGDNQCDQPNPNIVGEQSITCGIGRLVGANPAGAWGVDLNFYLPANTTRVQMTTSYYDDFGFTTANGITGGHTTMGNYYAGQRCGPTANTSYTDIPFTPGSYVSVNIYSLDTCGSVQEGRTTFSITTAPSSVGPPPPSAPTIGNLPACVDGPYTGSGQISWSGAAGSGGFYLDIDDDPNFGSYFNKNVASGIFSTNTSGFQGIYPQTTQSLVLNPGLTYYVRIYNGSHSPASSFQVPYCQPTLNLTGRTETGTFSDGPVTVDYNHPLVLAWTSQSATSCTASGGNAGWSGSQEVSKAAGQATANLTQNTTFTLTCLNAIGQTASDSLTAIVVLGPGLSAVNVVGDIFSGTGVAGITVDASSVVAAAGSISVGGTNFTVPGYQQSPVNNWETIREAMLQNANRLRSERAVTITPNNGTNVALPAPGSSSRLFNLNPKSGNPFDGNSAANPNQPEGGVFYVAGDLVITAPLTFLNGGTIIVGGSIRLQGGGGLTMTGQGTLGLIALGSGGITIDPVINEFHATALFAANGPIVFSN